MTSTLYDTAAELSATAADLAAAIDTDEPTYYLACHAANLLADLNAGLCIGVPPEPADLRHIARQLHRELRANRRPAITDANQLDVQALCVAEEAGELVGAYRRYAGKARRTGTRRELEDEIADVLIVTAMFAERAGIDLHAALTAKLAVIYSRGWHQDDSPADGSPAHPSPPITAPCGCRWDAAPGSTGGSGPYYQTASCGQHRSPHQAPGISRLLEPAEQR